MSLRMETKARARAVQLLYAAETQDRDVDEVISGLARLTGPEPALLDRTKSLANGVRAGGAGIDALLAAASEHWRLDRLAVIDRIILRLGTFELQSDVPPRVAIDEALWLAHRFGTPQSPAFINGVLDRVARGLGRL